MNIYLAGTSTVRNLAKMVDSGDVKMSDMNILESFVSVSRWQTANIKQFRRFMLDSGAFTFMRRSKTTRNWDEYVEKYSEYIKSNGVERFFELDIDNIVGIEEVERLRKKLETLTNMQCIPVWHISRGKEYFLKMCEEYDYVSVGGIVTKEIIPKYYDMVFLWMIHNAHKRNVKIHGLGFTNIKLLSKYPFDSVDSTTFLTARFGKIYRFNNKGGMDYIAAQHIGARLVGTTEKAKEHNLKEFIKFSKYAERNL